MTAAPLEIFYLKIERAQIVEVFGSRSSEQIEQLGERLAGDLTFMSRTIERLERLRIARVQDRLDPRHPVPAPAMNEMTDRVEHRPRGAALISRRPCLRQIAQQRIQRGRRAAQ